MYHLNKEQKLANLKEQKKLLNQKILKISKQLDGIQKKIDKLSASTTVSAEPPTESEKLNNFSN